ncbi:SURF1 family protein [Aliamphritea ceti]|uniref:SURF1 family protein n=1 Tax=Aliamphritea ceti TaxID=1524258 RepID=UPI0021C26F6B|nr:SURF1 family protein [Aliamphritea ceti]
MSKEHSWGWCKRVVFGVLLILVPVMLGLGFWQLERAEYKQQILDRWEATLPTLSYLPRLIGTNAGEDGIKVKLKGRLLDQKFMFLDNKIRQGKAGYELLVVLEVKGSPEYVLLNLGWLNADVNRNNLPKIALPTGDIEIQGRLITPVKGFSLGITQWQEYWPQRIQQIDLQAIKDSLGFELYPQVVQMDFPLVAGVQVGWSRVNMPPERHIGYAFQWFMMSFALLICLIVFVWRTSGTASWMKQVKVTAANKGDK